MNENQNSSSEQSMEKYFFRASAADFRKIPGIPVAYDMPNELISQFEKGNILRKGLRKQTPSKRVVSEQG